MAFNPASIASQPIVSLTPFLGGRPWLKARATDKSSVRTWSKPTSSGKLFSCTFIDESAAIRATFFNDQVDQFEQLVQEGQVYCVSGFAVKNSNRRFNNVNNDYEITMERDSQMHVVDAAQHGAAIPTVRYNFCPVRALQSKEKNASCDVLVIVTAVGEPSEIVTKAEGKRLLKRTLTATDQNARVDVTVWDDLAVSWAYPPGSLLALRSVRVNNWDGVSLSLGRDSVVEPNPPLREAEALRAWYATTSGVGVETITTGRQANAERESKGRVYLATVDQERFGSGEKPEYCELRVVAVYVRTENVWYDACPSCNKKVTPAGDGFRCEKCDKTHASCEARYLSSIQVSDGVSLKWLTLFQEAGESFWGVKAGDLKLKSAADPTEIARIAQERLYVPLIVTARCKLEERTGSDGGATSEIRLTAVRLADFNGTTVKISNECRSLASAIEAYHI